jgi:hypothetical protein
MLTTPVQYTILITEYSIGRGIGDWGLGGIQITINEGVEIPVNRPN